MGRRLSIKEKGKLQCQYSGFPRAVISAQEHSSALENELLLIIFEDVHQPAPKRLPTRGRRQREGICVFHMSSSSSGSLIMTAYLAIVGRGKTESEFMRINPSDCRQESALSSTGL